MFTAHAAVSTRLTNQERVSSSSIGIKISFNQNHSDVLKLIVNAHKDINVITHVSAKKAGKKLPDRFIAPTHGLRYRTGFIDFT